MVRDMGEIEKQKHREALGKVSYPPEVQSALEAVTELPDDPEKQAEFFDRVHEALGNRLRDDS
jgi:hypothetical protein